MNHTRFWFAAAIIAVVIIVGFVLSVPHTRDVPETSLLSVTPVIPSVVVRDVFKKGVHTITGSIEAPNACTTISVEASVQGNASTTENILVAISMPEDAGVCLQLPTNRDFKTTLSAPADLPIIVTVNGAPATTTTP